MPAGDFRWSHQSFGSGLDGLKSAHDILVGELEALDTDLLKILGNWVGPARESYNIAQQEWSSSAQNITANLQAAHVTVQNTYDTYHSTEKQATGLFGM